MVLLYALLFHVRSARSELRWFIFIYSHSHVQKATIIIDKSWLIPFFPLVPWSMKRDELVPIYSIDLYTRIMSLQTNEHCHAIVKHKMIARWAAKTKKTSFNYPYPTYASQHLIFLFTLRLIVSMCVIFVANLNAIECFAHS